MSKTNKILCIGDIILDTYCKGVIERISPEAPIPVLKVLEDDINILGGSGNVARNIVAAGDKCHLISIIGNDNNGKAIKSLCKKFKNLTFDLIIDKNRCTTKKNRFVSGNQQILRVDSEKSDYISKDLTKKILSIVYKKLNQIKIIIISDYNKGLLTKELLEKIIQVSKVKNKIVIVDPKNRDLSIYKNADIITPNLKELFEATESNLIPNQKTIEKLSRKIIKDFGFQHVITTKSSDGISLVSKKLQTLHLPSKAKEVFDVSGAGDTVVSYIASGILRNYSLEESVKLANEAAGIAVSKFGTATVSRNEVNQKLKKRFKICSLNNLIQELKKKKIKEIGFTNGCFDLLHTGHIDYLQKSRNKCDFLILGLNSDASTKKLKGKSRPILSEEDRSEILAQFDFIDRIVIFSDLTPLKLINKIKPNYIFKGDDYKLNEVVGAREIRKWGGKVVLIKCKKDKSTSKIIERIKNGT